MAKILPGAAVNQISGTQAGTTWQNWRGMLIMREKPTPHNPQTPRQMEIRAITTELSRRWRDELTEGLRTAWKQRAKDFSWTNVFGKEIRMTGLNLYLKQNFVLLDFGLPVQDTPPAMVMPPELTDVVLTPDTATLTLEVPKLSEEVVLEQEPFLDIWVAGGFLTATFELEAPEKFVVNIETEALPQGRVHQAADFRHVLYAIDPPPPIVPPGDPSEIFVNLLPARTRNIVVLMRRYNRFGNYSQALAFEKIITSAG